MNKKISKDDIEKTYRKMNQEAEDFGYHFNPDLEITKGLIEGLLVNQDRYGYMLCPCRLTSGNKEGDLDIICPCDYRDIDVLEYDTCYCSLYVSAKVLTGKVQPGSIPERRIPPDQKQNNEISKKKKSDALTYPVWRCRVCGYLCARETPPEVCPICKAKKERFEQFM
jgi:ferredoxin-thioredoxin reductase catalytic chain